MNEATLNEEFVGHILFGPDAQPVVISIQTDFVMWDSMVHMYLPLKDSTTHGSVTVKIYDESLNSPVVLLTNSSGSISGSVKITPGKIYKVVVEVDGMTFGYRTFDDEIVMFRVAKKIGNSLGLFEQTSKLPDMIYDYYIDSGVNAGPSSWVDLLHVDDDAVSGFEVNFNNKNMNIIVEGDSWFDVVSTSHDLYDYVLADFGGTPTAPKVRAKLLPLQRWGHKSERMLEPVFQECQYSILLQYLNRYTFDLMLLSCGGNDFALEMPSYFKAISPTIEAQAASLSTNTGMGVDFTKVGSYDQIAAHVLSQLGSRFDTISFPYSYDQNDAFEVVVNHVLDINKVKAAFDDVYGRVERILSLLDSAAYMSKGQKTKIVSHTYCYPIYSEKNAAFKGIGDPYGPYFKKAFDAKGIRHGPLKVLCIIALIDAYKRHVLDKLKQAYPDRFDFADLRMQGRGSAKWADEMHLNPLGYREAATELYNKIKLVCPGFWQ